MFSWIKDTFFKLLCLFCVVKDLHLDLCSSADIDLGFNAAAVWNELLFTG